MATREKTGQTDAATTDPETTAASAPESPPEALPQYNVLRSFELGGYGSVVAGVMPEEAAKILVAEPEVAKALIDGKKIELAAKILVAEPEVAKALIDGKKIELAK